MRPKSGRRKKKTAEALKESIVNLLINNLANMVLKYCKLSAILIFISSWSLIKWSRPLSNKAVVISWRRLLTPPETRQWTGACQQKFCEKIIFKWLSMNYECISFQIYVECFNRRELWGKKVEIGLVSKCKPQTTYHWKELWIQENFCQQFENTFIPAVKIELLPLIYSNTSASNSRVVVDFCKERKGGGSKSTDQPKAEDYPSKNMTKIFL